MLQADFMEFLDLEGNRCVLIVNWELQIQVVAGRTSKIDSSVGLQDRPEYSPYLYFSALTSTRYLCTTTRTSCHALLNCKMSQQPG